MAESQEIALHLIDDTIDTEALADRAYRLKRELVESGAQPVSLVPTGRPPSGSKAADPIAVGALMVSLANSPSLIAAIAGTIQSWMNRTPRSAFELRLARRSWRSQGPYRLLMKS
jgi:hypothetical protein